MKKRIGTRNYDTATAELIAVTSDGFSLYQKQSGEYFATAPNALGGNLTPVSFKDAEEIAREAADPKVYRNHFGEFSEDSGGRKITRTLCLSVRDEELLKRMAHEEGLTLSALTQYLIKTEALRRGYL